MSKFIPPSGTSTDQMARYLDGFVRPNTYMVVQLFNGCGGRFVGHNLQIDDPHLLYDDVAFQTLRRISRAVYGQTGFRRRKRELIPNFCTLEGDGTSRRFHLNINMQRPSWLPYPEFERLCRTTWAGCPWAFKGPTSFWMEERLGDCVGYSLKDGIESLLLRSITPARATI